MRNTFQARKIESPEPRLRWRRRVERAVAGASSPAPCVRLAVTGDHSFAHRHRFLFDAIAENDIGIRFVTTRYRTPAELTRLLAYETLFCCRRIILGRSSIPRSKNDLRRFRRAFTLSKISFQTRTFQTEQHLKRLHHAPDVVLHIFSLSSPYASSTHVPYVHYLDFTAALARRTWPEQLPLLDGKEYADWLALERSTYQNAAHLFVMSDIVRRSLLDDYGVDQHKVTVVGSGGQFPQIYVGDKSFGSKRILFNARPFERKGGDVVLAAFERVRNAIPDATLIVVGSSLDRSIPGVLNPGFVSDAQEMRSLFLSSDIVVAPSRADPFPGFIIEAMSHKVPCIVSPLDGIPEIVDHGVNGVVLTRVDYTELAESIIGLLNDVPRLERFSRAAYAKALSRFCWRTIGLRIAERLKAICMPEAIPHFADSTPVVRDTS